MSENVGCLGSILRIFGVKAPDTAALPYRQRDDFLSPAELSFYRALIPAVGEKATLLAKVNLADIFFVVRPNENQAYRNKIDRKHVDFLLCDRTSMRPVLGIELDDSSHARAERRERDGFVDEVFRVADLPLMRVPAARAYDPARLSVEIAAALDGTPAAAVAASAVSPQTPSGSSPACPRCGSEMVLRAASKGERRGDAFWGCPNYPKCRGTLPHEGGRT